MTATPPPPVSGWHHIDWRGESAWCAARSSVLAVVTTARARLIYLGSLDGSVNLLNAPYPQVLPHTRDPWPNQGGHRFWLGPQKHWVWPPPRQWEYAAATSIDTAADVLTVRQPPAEPAYPAIVREYAWSGDRLRCTARWREHDRAWFGMHVIAVDLPFQTRAQLKPTPQAPFGVVQVNLEDTRCDGFLPHPALECNGLQAVITSGVQVLKVGFATQPLTVERRGGWQLSVLPGDHQGVVQGVPDLNQLSQVWVGGPEHDLAEMEQLTPYLRADDSGWCGSSIYLAATPPRAA